MNQILTLSTLLCMIGLTANFTPAPAQAAGDCGGLNQKSCWHADPRNWCHGDLKYKPGGLPGKGRCVARVTNVALKRAAKPVFDRIESLGSNNPLVALRSCLKRPDMFSKLRQQMTRQSQNGLNAILRDCQVNPASLRSYGQRVTGEASSTLPIAVGAGVVALAGAEGGMG